MRKFGGITQGLCWHGLSAGPEPVTCTEDKGGDASPWLLAKTRGHEGAVAERRSWWRRRGSSVGGWKDTV